MTKDDFSQNDNNFQFKKHVLLQASVIISNTVQSNGS